MQYMLMIYLNEAEAAQVPRERMEKMMPAYAAYTEAMHKAGAWVAGDRLRPTSTATTVRMRDDKVQVLDGPYADTKEQFGGFYVVEAADLDAAIDWAKRCPAAQHGVIEVRPLWHMEKP